MNHSMKMLFTTCLMTVLVVTALAQRNDGNDTSVTGPFVKGFIAAIIDIVGAGDSLWDVLAQKQAKDAVDAVGTGAANLELKKNALLADLKNNQIKDQGQLFNRVRELKEALRQLKTRLDKFATEIDGSAPKIGGSLRVYIGKVETEKVVELDSISFQWNPADPNTSKAATDHLNEAIKDLQRIRAAVDCLKVTIEKRTAGCDVTKL